MGGNAALGVCPYWVSFTNFSILKSFLLLLFSNILLQTKAYLLFNFS